MREKFTKLILEPRTLLFVYVLAAVGAAVQMILLGTHPYIAPLAGTYPNDIMNKPEFMNLFNGKQMTEYNNYLIFKYSFFHLLDGTNLYTIYPDRHWDFFKYSPTFALLMGTMAYLPDVIGLSIWNVLNAITVFFAIRMLPFKTKVQCLLLWFAAMELLTSLQNTQSNGLMCGLMIAAYGSMQRGKPLWATLWLVLSVYIKVYGAIGFCLFLFYPGKPRFILFAAMWMLIFAVLPLMVTPASVLIWQYQNWGELMIADAAAATGMSVAGWLRTWFGIDNVKSIVSIAGLLLFLIQFIRLDLYRNERYKLLMLASMLIWVVIFNHKAESPTFIISIAGVGIWYYASAKTTWRTTVFALAFVFTSLATTDIFPPFVRNHFIYPYTIKAVPCIIAWFVVLAEIVLMRRQDKVTEDRWAETPAARSISG
jgi:hypothetical protein